MPESVGRYQIKGELGRGGFGRVYRAWDPTMGRDVAIKTLAAGGDPELLLRFRNEAAAAGKLRHRNIIIIYDFGEQDGEPFIVMELLDGEDLQRLMRSGRTLTLIEKLRILEQVAEGLHHAHRNGVVHRDVKPANVMVLPDATVKLMDFGIALVTQAAGARLTRTGIIPGTLKYMAPEQFRGATNDPLSDIFAYGVVAYELLAGQHPFEAPSEPAIMYNILSAEPQALPAVNPQCPASLWHVVERCLQKDRESRCPSLDELLLDLRPVLTELRQEQARGMLGEAQRLNAEGQQETARSVLREVLELDPGNREARELRELLQTEMRRRSVGPKVDVLLDEARRSLEQKQFDAAARAADAAVQLDRSSREAVDLAAQARGAKQQAEQTATLVEQAKAALSSGDETAAYRLAGEIVRLDPRHAEGTQLLEQVRESISLREHQRRLSDGMQTARGAIERGAHGEAIALLERLSAEFPSRPELVKLLQEARAAESEREREERIGGEVMAARELMARGRLDEAVSRLEAADRLFTGTPAIRELLTQTQQMRSALPAVEQVPTQRPPAVDAPAAPATPATRKTGMLLWIAAGVVALAAGGGYVALRSPADSGVAAPVTSTAVPDGSSKSLAPKPAKPVGQAASKAAAPVVSASALVITGATPGAEVHVDGTNAGMLDSSGSLNIEVAAGRHTVEIFKDKFEPRTFDREFGAGQKVTLSAADAALSPKPDPQTVLAQEWERIRGSRDIAAMEDFARRNPNSPLARTALDQAAELRWNAVDKRNAAALRDYGAKNASSRYAATALDTAARLDWEAVDKNDAQSLQAYLQRNPPPAFAGQAKAELDRLTAQQENARKAAEVSTVGRVGAEREGIQLALRKFSAAIVQKDINAMVAVFPNVNVRMWQQSFAQYKSMSLSIRQAGPIQLRDNIATVVCERTGSSETREGEMRTMPAMKVTVRLNKTSTGWVIQSIEQGVAR